MTGRPARTGSSLLALLLLPLFGVQVSGGASNLQATKAADNTIVLTRTFSAPCDVVFDALTNADHLMRWMKSSRMVLLACVVDLRAGGSFRYVFQRPSGRKIEVRGNYEKVEPPRRFIYLETYDFSPLTIRVTTDLEDRGGETVFTQTLVYTSAQERDQDFDSVTTSAAEAYASLERYLEPESIGSPGALGGDQRGNNQPVHFVHVAVQARLVR